VRLLAPETSRRAGLFVLSASTLALEILETRIFSVVAWHHLTYLLVTVALLGFGAAGAFLTLFRRRLLARPADSLVACSLLFAATAVGTLALLGRRPPDTARLLEGPLRAAFAFLDYGYLVLPYFFAGLAVAIALAESGAPVPARYFWNLAGSGLGCWLFVAAITPLGAAGSALLCAGLGILAAACFGQAAARRWRAAAHALLAAGIALLAATGPERCARAADALLPFPFAATKTAARALRSLPEARIVHTEWSPLCRLDAVDFGVQRPADSYQVFQDGDAPTTIFRAGFAAGDDEGAAGSPGPFAEALRRSPRFGLLPGGISPIYALAYLFVEEPKVLVIGAGGGHDLLTAVHHGARSVRAAEINPVTAGWMRGRFRAFAGDPYRLPGVAVEVEEGRSLLRRTRERFDLIQMTGTDTYAALASGAYVLSESYLYTAEAMRDYFAHLEPRGVLAILRPDFEPPRENLRLFGLALLELRSRGVAAPSGCAAVVLHDAVVPLEGREARARFAVSLFRPTPFAPAEVERLERFCDSHREDRIGFAPGRGTDGAYSALARAVDERSEGAFFARYPFDVTPVRDDRPFFFQYHRWGDLRGQEGTISEEARDWLAIIGEKPVGLWILLALLLQATVASSLLILLPLLAVRAGRDPSRSRGTGAPLLYFLSLGIGFIALEIATMQRTALFLGHPIYSLTVTLFAFLAFPGLGSLLSVRLAPSPRTAARAAVGAIAAAAVLHALFLDRLFAAALGAPFAVRVGLSLLALAPLGVALGIPFPSGLRILEAEAPDLLPWAIGVNGTASVLGSVATLLLSISLGFRACGLVAAGIYLLGTAPLLRRRAVPPERIVPDASPVSSRP
jgi:hypothetical protein